MERGTQAPADIQAGLTPFRHWVIDNWCNPLKSERMADAMQHHWQVSYDNDVERGKRTSRDFITMLPELHEAFIQLRCPSNVKRWAEITGIESLQDDPQAHGAGLHCSVEGSFLQAHTDYQLHGVYRKERRLNLILFMHDHWEKEWGGELLLCDPSGKAIVAIEPKPGRLAVFECGAGSMHGTREITGNKAIRLSCAVYYLADIREGAWRTRAMFLPNRSKNNEAPYEVSRNLIIQSI